MKILHYSLDLYPRATGGLSKYVTDLAIRQAQEKNDVVLVYPSYFTRMNTQTRFKKNQEYKKIKVFEVLNPLPVSIFSGISPENIDAFTEEGNLQVYMSFLENQKPDIINVHTLMGLHLSFLTAAKKLKIKIVYTAHDFFGVCPVTTLYKKNHVCEYNSIGTHCFDCNNNNTTLKTIKFKQGRFIKLVKTSFISKYIRKLILRFKRKKTRVITGNSDYACAYKFNNLNVFYQEIFTNFDYFLFNSEITYLNYKKRVKFENYEIINITHDDIRDNRKIRKYSGNKLRIAYMTSTAVTKGYRFIIDAVKELNNEGINIELHMYNDSINDEPYIKNCGKFKHDELSKIYDSIDLVVVPSLSYETFGFLVLEAFSYGVVTVMSNLVGAKFLIENNKTGIIIEPTLNEMKRALKELSDKKNLSRINRNIKEAKLENLMDNHYIELETLYKKVVNI